MHQKRRHCRCADCSQTLKKNRFSKNQLTKQTMRCKKCISSCASQIEQAKAKQAKAKQAKRSKQSFIDNFSRDLVCGTQNIDHSKCDFSDAPPEIQNLFPYGHCNVRLDPNGANFCRRCMNDHAQSHVLRELGGLKSKKPKTLRKIEMPNDGHTYFHSTPASCAKEIDGVWYVVLCYKMCDKDSHDVGCSNERMRGKKYCFDCMGVILKKSEHDMDLKSVCPCDACTITGQRNLCML